MQAFKQLEEIGARWHKR